MLEGEPDPFAPPFGGQGGSQALHTAWMALLSQYHHAREDGETKEYIEITSRMAALRLRAAVINLLLNVAQFMGAGQCRSVVNAIKKFDEDFAQFEFTEESFETDLQGIRNLETGSDIAYRDLVEWQKESEKLKTKSEKLSEQSFYDMVLSYNEIFKTSHSVDRLNTMEYARMCYRQEQYIDHLNNQHHG